MSISCDHARPALNLPGRTPPRLAFNAPTFIPTSSPAEMARALLEAFRGISAALSQIGARRTVVPLVDATIRAREGQIITGVADGQVIELPQSVQDGAIGQVTVLLSAVKTPLTVVNPDGTTTTLSEPGIYEYALGSLGEVAWVTPPGAVAGIRAISAGTTSATTGTVRFSNAGNVSFGMAGNTITATASFPAATAFVLSNSNGLSWGTAGSTVTGSFSTLSFSNANNVTFGIAGSTLTASATVASTQASIRISAGTTSVLSSGFTFTNSHNVSWTMNNGTLAASATVASTQASIQISGGTTNTLASAFSFANSFNVSFTLNGATLNASATVASTQASISFAAAGVTNNLSNLTFSNSNNVSFGLAGSVLTATATVASTQGSITVSAGASSVALTNFVLSNSNNVSFGLSTAAGGGTVTASVTVASTADPQIGLVSHIGGNSVSSVTRLAFSNASNVTFSLSTALNAATLLASVAAGGGGGITALALSNAVSSVAATGITFSNANGFSFLLSTAAGNAATISGSYTAPTHTLAVSAAGNSVSNGTFVISNSNNVSFGMAGSTITASATVASTQASIRLSAGTTSILSSGFTLSNSNNVSFGIDAAGVVTATATVATSLSNIRISAGPTSNLLSALTFANGSGVSFGLNASTLTASVDPEIGLLSHVGGNSVGDATRLAFSNGSGVSFGLSTAVGAATLTASVATSLTAINISAGVGNSSASAFSFANSNNISFGINGATITAIARGLSVSHVGGGAVADVATLVFSNASNVTWSLDVAAGVATARASVAPPLALIQGTDVISSGSANFTPSHDTTLALVGNVSWNITGQTVQAAAAIVFSNPGGAASRASRLDFVNSNGISFGLASTSNASGRVVQVTAQLGTDMVAWRNFHFDGDNGHSYSLSIGTSRFYVSPLNVYFDPWPCPMTVRTLDIMLQGPSDFSSTQSTQAHGLTYRGGLYTLANSTQLSLVNSFSLVISGTTESFTNRRDNFANARWATVASSLWSSAPVMTPGVQYWYGFHITTSGTSVITQALGQQANQMNVFQGIFGVAQSATQASGIAPFWGVISATTPPVSIGQAILVSGNSTQRDAVPLLQFRASAALA